MINNRIYISLYKIGDDIYVWEKDWKYFYIFPASKKNKSRTITWDFIYKLDDYIIHWNVIYWLLVFNSKEIFDKRVSGEKVDADMVATIKARRNDRWGWLVWMLFDNKNRKAYFIDLTDDNSKWDNNCDRCLILIETIYKEITNKNYDLDGRLNKWSDWENISDLIKSWESLTLEFKQTFFLDVKTKKEADYIRKESLKNIAWFMNKDGGTLLVWVCDNWDIYGIENDNYKSNDDYLKRFKDIVKTNFTPWVLNLIRYEIITVENKKVLCVNCPRSNELIFLKWEPDWAYVRINPAVEKISWAALVDYAKIREKENEKKINKN